MHLLEILIVQGELVSLKTADTKTVHLKNQISNLKRWELIRSETVVSLIKPYWIVSSKGKEKLKNVTIN